MKILQLCKYYPPILGGIELVEKTITKAHTELGDQVHIISFEKKEARSTGEFGENIYLIKEDLFFKSAPINFSFLFKMRKVLKEHAIERVYVHLPNPFMHEVVKLSRKFFKKNNIQVVAVYHSDIVNQKKLGDLYTAYFLSGKNAYDLWICSSDNLWKSSKVLSSLPEEKKRVIPFCTDGVIHYKQRDAFKGKLLAVGRMVPYKGFEFLVNAINKTHYELHIIGNGPQYEKIKAIAGKNVFLHGHTTDQKKDELFNECDVLVVSSINRAEAYGMIIVEAFEAGLPVVSANINTGVTYLVQNEKTGLVFDIKNEEQLIASLNKLENDPDLYSKLSKNTKQFFDSELRYENFREKIKAL